MCADAPGAVKKLDVPIDRAQFARVADAADVQSAVYRGYSPHLSVARNMDSIFHGHLHTFIVRIMRQDGNGVGPLADFDAHAIEVALVALRGFHGMDIREAQPARPRS